MKSIQLALITLSLSLTSCSGRFGGQGYYKELKSINHIKSDASPSEKAEYLAEDAEELMLADGFEQANKVSNLALQQDPSNLKASFVYYSSAVVLSMKGFFKRLQPIKEKYPHLGQELDAFEKEAKLSLSPALLDFFYQGEADIENEAQVQLFFDQIQESLEKAKNFLILARGKEITIRPNPLFSQELNERFVAACEIKESKTLIFELSCPENRTRREITLNQADFEILKDSINYLSISLSLANPYTLDGALALAEEERSQKIKFSEEKKLDRLLSNQKFGFLRSAHRLKQTHAELKSLVTSAHWVIENQKTLCPEGRSSAKNRPGFFFNTGLCLSPQLKPYILDIEKSLHTEGRELNLVMKGEPSSGRAPEVYKSKINRTALLFNPVANIRDLGPFHFNACDEIDRVGDQSLGGTYPLKDANKVFEIQMDCKK